MAWRCSKRDLDWVAIVAVHDAGALAEHFDRAGPRTTATQYIGVENAQRRTAQIAGGDALDEAGNVDVRGAGGGAGRVEAVKAAMRLDQGGLRRERRLDFAKALAEQRIVGQGAVLIKTSGEST